MCKNECCDAVYLVRIMPLLANNEFSSFFIYLIFMVLFICSIFRLFSFNCFLFGYIHTHCRMYVPQIDVVCYV